MKTFLNGAVLIGCCLFYISYLFLLATVPLTPAQQKLYNYCPLLVLHLSTIIFTKLGIENVVQKLFIEVSKWIIAYTFLMIILHYLGWIHDVYFKIGIVYGGAALTTLFIEISGLRHGLFKNE